MNFTLLRGILAVSCLSVALGQPVHALGKTLTDPALPEVVVSATKSNSPASEATMSLSVITNAQMQAAQINDPLSAASLVPGVIMLRQGGLGQTTSLSIRGAAPQHTQIRFDDFPLRDASGMYQDFNLFLGNLNMEQGALNRVEVIKGPRSALYGSSAMGGVISLFTGSKWGEGTHGSVRAEVGSHGTVNVGGSISHGSENLYLNFNPIHIKTNGFKGQWFEQSGFTAGAGLRLAEKTTLEATVLASMTDALSTLNPVVINNKIVQPQRLSDGNNQETSLFLGGLTLTTDISDQWQSRVKASYTRTSRTYFEDQSHPYYPSYAAGGGEFLGEQQYAEWLNIFRPMDNLVATVGIDYEGSTLENSGSFISNDNIKKSDYSYAGFVNAQLALFDRSLILSAGGRYNGHSKFDSHATWDLGAAWLIKSTNSKIYANIATGYRTPSLYQTYGYSYGNYIGNKNLKPESSISYELGLTQSLWDKRVNMGFAVYRTEFKNLIDWVTTDWTTYEGHYDNKSKGRVQGLEANLNLRPWDFASFDLAYTYAKAQSRDSGTPWMPLESRPRHQVAGTITVYPIDALTVSATGIYQSHRVYATKGREKSFCTLNLATSYALNEHFALFARADNVFNTSYTQAGYHMPGFASYFGFEAKF